VIDVRTSGQFLYFGIAGKLRLLIQKILLGLFNFILPKLCTDILNLMNDIHSPYTDQQTVISAISYIDNAMNMKQVEHNEKYLNLYRLVSDFTVISLRVLIEQAIHIAEKNCQEELENSQKELYDLKIRVEKQFGSMKDSYEQEKNLAEVVGEDIFSKVKRLLYNTISDDIKKDILKSEYVMHHSKQEQAYVQSFEQANGENILKYVTDINHFLEVSLKHTKHKFQLVLREHTFNLNDLLFEIINTANKTVQARSCEELSSVNDVI
ncbi:unnamed protein product, partial [Didymodactylos carnosus]